MHLLAKMNQRLGGQKGGRMPPAVSSTGRHRILVVEDDQDILVTLSGLLEDEGYDVQSVGDARDALERLRHGLRPEVIILDLMMPGMDGWEFRTIQRADPTLSSIPVVAISADTSAKAAAIDATSFLRKPFRFTELLDTVQKIIVEQERQQMEARLAEAERLASLGTVAAGAAHEISNPLSFTVANLGTMNDQVDRLRQRLDGLPRDRAPEDAALHDLRAIVDDVRDLLADARVGAERVSRVVRNLQSIARRQEEQHRPVDILHVVESAITLTWNQIRHRARLVKEFGEVPLVDGSEFRLGQLFVNLLVNAAQAVQEGNAQVNEIKVTAKTDARGLVVEVADTGEGIPPEARARVFEPFFTTKPAGMGTGLGLSICQSVVLEHRGQIEVESVEGKGSLFRVILPVTAEQRRDQAAPPKALLAAPGRRGHLIVIDDEPQLAWAMKRLLDREHDVVAVTHGREALDRMSAGQRFDVILCDLTMPFMTGEQLYREIERRFGAEAASRILFVTGGALSEESNAFLQGVPNPRLFKPFEPDELRLQVRRLLDG
jgi:signal transduction histidine kinase